MENPIDPINKADAAVAVAGKAAEVIEKAATTVQTKALSILAIVLIVIIGFMGVAVYRLSNKVNTVQDNSQTKCEKDLQDTKTALAGMTANRDLALQKNEYKDSIQAKTNVTIGEQNQTIKYLQSQLEKK